MKKTILKNVNSANYLSFIIDYPPDIRHKEHVAIVLLPKKGELH
jgi:hypothetical protein